jgi:hypothetical protein
MEVGQGEQGQDRTSKSPTPNKSFYKNIYTISQRERPRALERIPLYEAILAEERSSHTILRR